MKTARVVAIYAAVFVAMAVVLGLLSLVPIFANGSIWFMIVFFWIVAPIANAVSRHLTGWPPQPSPSNLPLPLRGSPKGDWNVTMDRPGRKRYRLRWFLIYGRGLSPKGARAAARARKGPVLIGTSMTWDGATTFANELRARGASVSVHSRGGSAK